MANIIDDDDETIKYPINIITVKFNQHVGTYIVIDAERDVSERFHAEFSQNRYLQYSHNLLAKNIWTFVYNTHGNVFDDADWRHQFINFFLRNTLNWFRSAKFLDVFRRLYNVGFDIYRRISFYRPYS